MQSDSSDGSGVLWFLPIGLIGALGGLFALAARTRRRIA
jgi:cytochrome c-type biogenesis protein CcmH/NrfF